MEQIGLRALAANLERLPGCGHTFPLVPAHVAGTASAQAEADDRSRRSMERRLRVSGIKSFKPMADYEWNWPTKIERDIIERALTLDFLDEARNLVLVGRNGLGKTMIAQNSLSRRRARRPFPCSFVFRTAALLEELHRQTLEGRRRKLRTYANVGLLCVDEVGYLSFDDKAAVTSCTK